MNRRSFFSFLKDFFYFAPNLIWFNLCLFINSSLHQILHVLCEFTKQCETFISKRNPLSIHYSRLSFHRPIYGGSIYTESNSDGFGFDQ